MPRIRKETRADFGDHVLTVPDMGRENYLNKQILRSKT